MGFIIILVKLLWRWICPSITIRPLLYYAVVCLYTACDKQKHFSSSEKRNAADEAVLELSNAQHMYTDTQIFVSLESDIN